MNRLSRRQFMLGSGIASLGLLAGCGRWPWQAQPAARVPRVAVMHPARSMPSFEEGLRELGYIPGQTVVIEYRFAGGSTEEMPALAAELVAWQPDVMVTVSEHATRAALSVTSTIPIVTVGGDPLRSGLVANLARPGGMVTGISEMALQLHAKRLELLQATIPNLTRVTVLTDAAADERAVADRAENEAAAHTLGLGLQFESMRSPEDLPAIFEAAHGGQADALLMLIGPATSVSGARIAELALQQRLPMMADRGQYVAAGALMSYGVPTAASYHRAAYYVDRILKGTKPADLPIEQPMTFDFVVNMKTARELGIAFPNEIMLQVTEVIDQ